MKSAFLFISIVMTSSAFAQTTNQARSNLDFRGESYSTIELQAKETVDLKNRGFLTTGDPEKITAIYRAQKAIWENRLRQRLNNCEITFQDLGSNKTRISIVVHGTAQPVSAEFNTAVLNEALSSASDYHLSLQENTTKVETVNVRFEPATARAATERQVSYQSETGPLYILQVLGSDGQINKMKVSLKNANCAKQ